MVSFRFPSGIAVLTFLTASLISSTSYAGIVITGTRVIYPADQKEVSVKLSNTSTSPILVQSWLDNGNADEAPEKIKTPFILTPPINRVDGGKGQTLRLSYNGTPLPTDKESVFWLNVLEIPPKAKADTGSNFLQMAFRSRIKVFFRPLNLPGEANNAAKDISWSAVAGGVRATNPTPYFVSLVTVSLVSVGKTLTTDGKMIAPQSSVDLTFSSKNTINVGDKGRIEYVNDYGAIKTLDITLAH